MEKKFKKCLKSGGKCSEVEDAWAVLGALNPRTLLLGPHTTR